MNQTILDNKINLVSHIQDKFSNAKSTVVVEYRGLTVHQLNTLRRELREENVEFKVYKNSMVTRATTAAGYADLNDQLTGPNALAFGEDAVAPSRILARFAKNNTDLIIKGAVVEGKVVGIDIINELASLPNRDGMLSMLLSCLQSPIRSFACVTKAIADSKEDNTLKVEDTKEESKENIVTPTDKPVEETKPIDKPIETKEKE